MQKKNEFNKSNTESSVLYCHVCNKEWSVKGYAVLSSRTSYHRFVKVIGQIKVCPFCKETRTLKVIRYWRKDGIDT